MRTSYLILLTYLHVCQPSSCVGRGEQSTSRFSSNLFLIWKEWRILSFFPCNLSLVLNEWVGNLIFPLKPPF